MPDPEPAWYVEATGCYDIAAGDRASTYGLDCGGYTIGNPTGGSRYRGHGLSLYMGFKQINYPQIVAWVTCQVGFGVASETGPTWSIDWMTSPNRFGLVSVSASDGTPAEQPVDFLSQVGKSSLRVEIADDGDITIMADGLTIHTDTIPSSIWDNYLPAVGRAELLIANERHNKHFVVGQTQFDQVGCMIGIGYKATLVQGGTIPASPSRTTSASEDYPVDMDIRWSPTGSCSNIPGSWYAVNAAYQRVGWCDANAIYRGDSVVRSRDGTYYTCRILDPSMDGGFDAFVFFRDPGALGASNSWRERDLGGWISLNPVGRPLGIMADGLHVVRQGYLNTRYSVNPRISGYSVDFDIYDGNPPSASYQDVGDNPWLAVSGIWDRADLIACHSPALDSLMAVAFYDGELLAVRPAKTDASIVSGLGDDIDAYITFLPDGRWYVGIFGDGGFTSYTSSDLGATWTQDRSDADTGLNLQGVAYWRTPTGIEAVCGWHEAEEELRLAYRDDVDDAWSSAVTIETGLDYFVQGMVMQSDTGIWECGYYGSSGWSIYRAGVPSGTWSAVS